MRRNRSGWGVTLAGLLLSGGGAYAMWSGWDMILVERGWSLFIAGSVALSGGVVTMALGRVIAHLARLASPGEERAEAVALSPAPTQARAPVPEAPPVTAAPPAPAPQTAFKPDFESFMQPRETGEAASEPAGAPVEVDRYSAGDATYIMMSDGSVEVHGPGGVERYPSLAALRAEAEARQK